MREYGCIKTGVIIPDMQGGIYAGFLIHMTCSVSLHLVDQGCQFVSTFNNAHFPFKIWTHFVSAWACDSR